MALCFFLNAFLPSSYFFLKTKLKFCQTWKLSQNAGAKKHLILLSWKCVPKPLYKARHIFPVIFLVPLSNCVGSPALSVRSCSWGLLFLVRSPQVSAVD